jgi:RNA 3'-terminal phosphate cyclase (ATP)
MIIIDGSQGEGGGQVLRTSLALSLMTGKDLEIYNVRANRSKPGLRPQHLKAVEAAASVGKAEITGAYLGSDELVFQPTGLFPGRFRFDIGTAGSTSLVLQTIFLPLSQGKSISSLTITGGTHVPWSPSFHYLEQHWLQFMQQVGCQGRLSLEAAGFYPKGAGEIKAIVKPAIQIRSLNITKRGDLKMIRGLSAVANLDRRIAERQRNQVLKRMGDRYPLSDIRLRRLPARYKGTMLLLLAEFEHSQACYFSLGELGKPAESVADETIDAMEFFLNTNGAVDQYLADQLLLPLAFASDPSRLSTSKVTKHLVTNAAIIKAFLPVRIDIEGALEQPGIVSISPLS